MNQVGGGSIYNHSGIFSCCCFVRENYNSSDCQLRTFKIDKGTLYSAPPFSLKPHGIFALSLVNTICISFSNRLFDSLRFGIRYFLNALVYCVSLLVFMYVRFLANFFISVPVCFKCSRSLSIYCNSIMYFLIFKMLFESSTYIKTNGIKFLIINKPNNKFKKKSIYVCIN